MNESTLYFMNWVVVGSIMICLFTAIFCVVAVFPKVREVESIVATPGKNLAIFRSVWGNGPMGRWMRCSYVFLFLVVAKVPRYGHIWQSRLGDDSRSVPLRLKLWILIPLGIFDSAALMMIGVGLLLNLF